MLFVLTFVVNCVIVVSAQKSTIRSEENDH